MAKKFRLESESDNDYTLIGIASHLKDYRLIWSLNETLDFGFVKMNDLRVFNDKLNETHTYPLFFYEHPDTFKTYYFIGNKNEKTFLIPEHKQTHYFLLVKGVSTPSFLTETTMSIKNIKNVLTAHTINLSLLKNFELILSDLELHMMEISMNQTKTF
jgi:hypothetical protein